MPVSTNSLLLMFRLYITLAYFIPHIYLFFRIRDNFITKRYKPLYVIVYLLLASIYPLVGRNHERNNFLMEVLSTVSDYLVPFYLYLFFFVLLFDFILLINLLARVIPAESRKSFKFRLITFSVLILLSAGVVAGGAINLNTIQVSKYRLEVPAKDSKIDHLRIAFVADSHFQQDFPLHFVQQFIRKVNDIKPDILLYGGDIVEGSRVSGGLKDIESALRKVTTKYGVYGVLGNHEGYGRREPVEFFQNSGITILHDTMILVDSSFYLAGRYDQQFRGRKEVNEITGGTEAINLPIIMMNHRPTELDETSLTEVDVQFSGHTHNGQLFPLNFIIHSMYELAWGYKKIRNTHFFVTSGLRLWGPPVKTAGKSEIMQVDIEFNKLKRPN